MAIVNRLKGSKSPNLPIGPVEYAQRYQDQLNNVLRLYFNEIDNITGALLGDNPGQFFNFPYIAASDSTDQIALGDNVPTPAVWDTLEGGYGWTLTPPGAATAQYAGIYKITYSLQFANTANAPHDATVWLRVNGTDIPNSATQFSLPARKSTSVPSYVCGYSEVVFQMEVGDVVELYWATDLAGDPNTAVDGVYMYQDDAQTSPYPRPAIPSAIGSIVFVSRKLT